jgi:hypothetical protein
MKFIIKANKLTEMNERILEILKEHIDTYQLVNDSDPIQITGLYDASAAITSHVMEFIEWIGLNTMTDRISRHKIKYMTSDMDSPAVWLTLSELYEYWLKNVKDATN